MGILLILLAVVLFLSWTNGANDNFKGTATLWGSGTAGFRTALVWATGATLLGSLVSVLIAPSLVGIFSGKGLIPDALITPAMLAAIGTAGGATVLLATALGMPTSTTHALTGALVGAGLMAAGASSIGWGQLLTRFAQPLLISPLLAIGGTALAYWLMRRLRLAIGIERQTCLCIASRSVAPLTLTSASSALLAEPRSSGLSILVGDGHQCTERYDGRLAGIDAQRAVDAVHYLSAGAVCFARAVNDTPKIAALLLAVGPAHNLPSSTGVLLLVAIAMAGGGWVQSRKVAETMSKRITGLNPGQGLTANLVTAALVLGASRFGVPVSTTHVSCGSIFGIGLATGSGNGTVIFQVLTTWVTTVPVGLALGALFYGLYVGAGM